MDLRTEFHGRIGGWCEERRRKLKRGNWRNGSSSNGKQSSFQDGRRGRGRTRDSYSYNMLIIIIYYFFLVIFFFIYFFFFF